MNFKLKRLETFLPAFFPSLLKELRGQGLVLTLVGGVVRDFLRTDRPNKDWDIELTHMTLPWSKELWKELGKSLSKLGRVNHLPYEVIRLEVEGYSLEFTPPRKEIFSSELASEGHKNFTVVFDFKMPFQEAAIRRDFTINAMGLRFIDGSIEFLDPLEGLRHLRENLLHPAGPDFPRDPVRFLRALRFAWKFKMEMSPELKVFLQDMDAGSFTPAYLWKEMQKSGDPLGFYYLLLKWSTFHPEMRLPLGDEIQGKYEELKRMIEEPSQHESWIIALEWVGLSAKAWQAYFNLSSESGRRLGRWARESRLFQKILPEIFHAEFEEVREKEEFLQLFDWYFTTKQLLQKNPRIPLMKMIEEYLPDWIHLYRFEPVKDVKHIDPPYRAKYQVWNLCQRL